MGYKYLYEKHYNEYNNQVERKIFKSTDDLLSFLMKENKIQTLFNAGFNDAVIKLYRIKEEE